MEVIRDEIVVAVVNNAANECRECTLVAESALLDGLEDVLQIRVDLVLSVKVGVAKVFDIFSQVTEQEDVLIAGLAGNLDLRSISIIQIYQEGDLRWRHHRFQ